MRSIPKNAAVRAMAPRLCGLPMPSRIRSGLPSRAQPGCRRRIELGERPRPGDRGDAAMQHRAGDARQLVRVDLAIGLARAGERGAEPAGLAAQPRLEKQPLDPAGIALEQAPTAASPQTRSSSAHAAAAVGCRAFQTMSVRALRHCDGGGAGRGIEPGGVLGEGGARGRAQIEHVPARIDAQADLRRAPPSAPAAGRRASATRDTASPDRSGRWRSAPLSRDASSSAASSEVSASPGPPSRRSPCQSQCWTTSPRQHPIGRSVW